jgi:hypothetical protein
VSYTIALWRPEGQVEYSRNAELRDRKETSSGTGRKARSAFSRSRRQVEHLFYDSPKRLASTKISRRQALRLFGGTVAGTTLGFLASCGGAVVSERSPIVVENQQAGSSDWRLGQPGYRVADNATGQIKGYASATSVNKGEQIDFHVTVNPAQGYTIDVYRMGWYDGQGGRLLQNIDPLDGISQPECTVDPATGLADCDWSSSYTLAIPNTWTSGIYLAVLTNEQSYQNYIVFVVRDDTRTADLLYQQSVTTYQAYNNYPDDNSTGKSLYDYNSYGSPAGATGSERAAKVSFNRPYGDGYGAGQFADAWNPHWERHFISWLEKSGYDVTYSTNLDTHANGTRLLACKGFLSVGHDEYWSKEMYDAVEVARNSGVHVAFFGSNACYWQVRFEPSANNVPDRTLVCYKDADRDPVQDSTTTVQWRDPYLNRSEQGLVGVQFTADIEDPTNTPYVVENSSHWVYDGTGFDDGDQVPGLVGYEADRYMPEYPEPKNTHYTLLSRSPITGKDGRSDYSNSSIYRAPSGAWVFASGTMQWSWGLDKQGVVDPRIQRTTANILDAFVGSTKPPSSG